MPGAETLDAATGNADTGASTSAAGGAEAPRAEPWVLATGAAVATAACGGGADAPPAALFEITQAVEAPGLLRRRALAAAAPGLPVPDTAALFAWAEAVHGHYFPGPQQDRHFAPYVLRYYPSTGNYLGVAGQDVYALGPPTGERLVRVGSLTDLASNVHGDVRPVDPADAAAARLLLQTQFSASDAEIALVRQIGAAGWVAQQTAAARGRTGVEWLDHRGCYDTSVRKGMHVISWPAQWMAWNQMLTAPDAVRARATLALSEYFVVSTVGVDGPWISYSMAHYWDTLAENAFGNFRVLLEKVTLNYAMGTFLNTARNRKEDDSGRRPDENYAREVMQLFTIGLHLLNPDGTEKLDAQGRPIETYTNDDVSNLARVFTGYEPAPDPNPLLPTDDPLLPRGVRTRATMVSPMVFEAIHHSPLEKRFLGTLIPAGTNGPLALRIALDTLFDHPNVGPFFARQMIQRLVVSNPSPAYVGRAAAVFADNGQGVRGDLRAVFSAIWLDAEARGTGSTEASRLGRLSEPMIRIAQWGRTFASERVRQRWNLERLFIDSGVFLNQNVLASPTVFNFFRPGYVPPSTPLASRGWVAPEFQIVDEANVAIFMTLMTRFVRSGATAWLSDEVWGPDGRYVGAPNENVPAEYERELPLAPIAGALVQRLNLLLCAGRLPERSQRLIIDALNATPVSASSSDAAKLDRIAAAVLMVIACPEYLVQH